MITGHQLVPGAVLLGNTFVRVPSGIMPTLDESVSHRALCMLVSSRPVTWSRGSFLCSGWEALVLWLDGAVEPRLELSFIEDKNDWKLGWDTQPPE